jgi:hypothetical protein
LFLSLEFVPAHMSDEAGQAARLASLQTLAGGSRITTLNLSGNNIGDAGAKALAEMLKVGITFVHKTSGFACAHAWLCSTLCMSRWPLVC